MRSELSRGKVLYSSSNHGISIVHDKFSRNLIRLGKYGNLGKRKRGSHVSYSRSSFKVGRRKEKEAYHPFKEEKAMPPLPREPVEIEAEIEEVIPVECPAVDGLILASRQGYWLLAIDSEQTLNSTITWLGNDPSHICTVSIIGAVTRFTDAGYISGLPARWAFEDRVRKFCMPTRYSSNNLFPYKTSVVWKNGEDVGGVDSTSFGHYGYSIPMEEIRNGIQSMALPGGVYGAMSYKWFSRNFLCLSKGDEDFNVFDTIGWDAFRSMSGIHNDDGIEYGRMRIRGLEPEEDCVAKSVRSGIIRNRVLDSINNARMCDSEVHAVMDGNADYAVAYDYAQEMATYEHFSHTGYFGSTLEERATAGGLTWSLLGEVLALIDDPGIGDIFENKDAVADQIVSAWENSPIHWDALMSSSYFRFSCGVFQNLISEQWYACGLLRALDTDEHLYNDSLVTLAVPPPMAAGVYEEDSWKDAWIPYNQYVSCRGFNTMPVEEAQATYVTRRIWVGYIVPFSFYAQVQDNFEYKSDTGVIEGEVLIPQNTIEYADYIEEYALDYYNGCNIRDWTDNVNFYFQYTGTLNKDIFVTLGPMGALPDTPDEVIENVPSSNRADGNTTLFMGTCEIDNAQRDRFHGDHSNPFQNITVAGIFHSNSGYTVIVYTRPETLFNDYIYWDYTYTSSGLQYDATVYQRYYKIKQSLWCAVVKDNVLQARWEIKGLPQEEYELRFLPQEDVYVQIDAKQDFIVNFNGNIEPGSVQVECIINDTNILFTDAEDGTLTEIEYQISGEQFLLASSSIDYDAGVVNYTLGSLYPDIDTDVITKAEVSTFLEDMLPFESTTEIITESWDPGRRPTLSDITSYNPVSFNTTGVFPAAISGTITEDGKHVVLTHSLYDVVPSGSISRVTTGAYDNDRYKEDFVLRYNNDPPQVLIFDITQKDEETELIPKMVNFPFYLIREQLTETVVLN